jgi:predicted ATPase
LVYALNFTAGLHQLRQEPALCQEDAEAAVHLAREQGFPVWAAMGTILLGWAVAKQGQLQEGIVRIQEGLAAWRSIGAEISLPYFLALLAEVHRDTGTLGQGLTILNEALTIAHKTGDRWWEAELYRLKGEFAIQAAIQGSSPEEAVLRCVTLPTFREATECFQQALEIARGQRAKSLQLRAAISLGRVWRRQGKGAAARQLVVETYGWFTEGFDTKDLQQARALLEEFRADVVIGGSLLS